MVEDGYFIPKSCAEARDTSGEEEMRTISNFTRRRIIAYPAYSSEGFTFLLWILTPASLLCVFFLLFPVFVSLLFLIFRKVAKLDFRRPWKNLIFAFVALLLVLTCCSRHYRSTTKNSPKLFSKESEADLEWLETRRSGLEVTCFAGDFRSWLPMVSAYLLLEGAGSSMEPAVRFGDGHLSLSYRISSASLDSNFGDLRIHVARWEAWCASENKDVLLNTPGLWSPPK